MNQAIIGILLAVTAIAGCAQHDDHANPYHSFEEAMAAEGRILHGTGGNTTIIVKLLAPYPFETALVGDNRVILLLYDNDTMLPVTDATITLATTMPVMGHGTDDESDPIHEGFGVYIGHTDLFMPGDWELRFDVFGVPGLDAIYVAPVTAGGDGMDDMDDGKDQG